MTTATQIALTPEQKARRTAAREQCDQIRAELLRRGSDYGTSATERCNADRQLARELANAYEVVAETSTCPAYEQAQARAWRAWATRQFA